MRSASKAGGGFFKFILSVVSFYDVAKEIRPKRERVKMLERDFAKAKKELQMLTEAVAQLEQMMINLRRQFSEAQSEMERLKNEMNVMLRQLLAAEKLTAGLASEKVRYVNIFFSLLPHVSSSLEFFLFILLSSPFNSLSSDILVAFR